jgi:TetR/AcrR family transcriptional regulator
MGIKERKEREKKRRRNAILNAAKTIIREKGVEGMTMNQVADLTELNKATLYSYFSNKDDLIDAVVYDGLILLEKDLQEHDEQSASGLNKVMSLTRATFDFYREHPVYFYALNHQERRGSSADRETPYSIKGNEIASRIFAKLRKSVQRGVEDGSVREGIDTNRLSVIFFAYTYGVMHTVLSKEDVYVDVLGLDSEVVERSALEFLKYFLQRRY